MMDFRDLYKIRRIPTLSDTVAKHYQDIITCRQEKQREFFWSKRGQPEVASLKTEALEKKKITRMEMLLKWKAEKLKKLEEEKKKCRPIFKVGIVQKKVTGSPLIIDKKNFNNNVKKKEEKIVKSPKKNEKYCEGIITRSKARIQKTLEETKNKEGKKNEERFKTDFKLNNKFCKVETGKIKKINAVAFRVPEQVAALPYFNRLTFPDSPNVIKKKNLSSNKCDVKETFFQSSKKQTKMSISNNENAKNKDEFKMTQKISEIKSLDSSTYKQISYSPFAMVQLNEREENGKTQKYESFESENKNKNNDFHYRILSFREFIDIKTKMLLEKCEKWKKIITDFEISENVEIQGEINSVIGKTILLTSDKFSQFKNLIDKCYKEDPLIKLDDLEGYKDWVSIEVEKIIKDFEKLEKLKINNWIPESFFVENFKNQKKKTGLNKKPVAKSKIREHIQAARKMLKNESCNLNFQIIEDNPENEKISEITMIDETSESDIKNNYILNLNQFVTVNREKHNSNLEIISRSGNKSEQTKNNSPVLKGYETKNLVNNKFKIQKNIFFQDYQNSANNTIKTTPIVLNSSKNNSSFNDSENCSKGLSEKYFRHPENDNKTPFRIVLGEMNSNVTPLRTTRSMRQNIKN